MSAIRIWADGGPYGIIISSSPTSIQGSNIYFISEYNEQQVSIVVHGIIQLSRGNAVYLWSKANTGFTHESIFVRKILSYVP